MPVLASFLLFSVAQIRAGDSCCCMTKMNCNTTAQSKKAALPAQPLSKLPYSAYSLTAPAFCRAAITAGIRTNCTIMPGTALSSAPAKNA